VAHHPVNSRQRSASVAFGTKPDID